MVAAFIGGCLIGLASALLLLTHGRVAGIAGIVAGLLYGSEREALLHRALFVAGMIGAGVAARFLVPHGGAFDRDMAVDIPLLAVAGLLVGFGTRMGNGCTSGHGVCGISRFSKRSITATVVFMAFGVLTTFIVRHVVKS